MSLTREERQTIETLIKTVRTLEKTVTSQKLLIDSLFRVVNSIDSRTDMSQWTMAQWSKFLKPYLTQSTRNTTAVVLHDHTNEQNGGDCFAKLGANLINGE